MLVKLSDTDLRGIGSPFCRVVGRNFDFELFQLASLRDVSWRRRRGEEVYGGIPGLDVVQRCVVVGRVSETILFHG